MKSIFQSKDFWPNFFKILSISEVSYLVEELDKRIDHKVKSSKKKARGSKKRGSGKWFHGDDGDSSSDEEDDMKDMGSKSYLSYNKL